VRMKWISLAVVFHHVDGLRNIGLWVRLDFDLLCDAVLVIYESVQERLNLTRDLALLETDDCHLDRAHAEVPDDQQVPWTQERSVGGDDPMVFRFENKSAASSSDNHCSCSGTYRPLTWQY
jgi:hypothetical protein